MDGFLPGDRSGWGVGRWWQVAFALLVTVALTAGGVQWLSDRDRAGAGAAPVSLAQGFADAALAAFSTSITVTASDSGLTAAQRVPCAGQSFIPDTLVLLADGTKRPVAQLTVGDRVWSTDPDTGYTSGQMVQAVLVDYGTDLLDLTITSPADVTSVVRTTAKTPVPQPRPRQAQTTGSTITDLANSTTQIPADTARWVAAIDLRPGDQLATPPDKECA